MICAQCGHENPETNKFCEECGCPLTAAPAGPEVAKDGDGAVLRRDRLDRAW